VLQRPIEPKQFTSIRYGERLAEIGATPSIGTVGDSYDNALAETVNGYYKPELVRGPARQRPWKTVEDLELAAMEPDVCPHSAAMTGCMPTTEPAATATARVDRTGRRRRTESGSGIGSR